ncbi:hypothetical protein ACF0H5_005832 [Mactra antiquata]
MQCNTFLNYKRKWFFSFLPLGTLLLYLISQLDRPHEIDEELAWESAVCKNYWEYQHSSVLNKSKNTYLITWYQMSSYIRWREDAVARDFKQCKYSNCMLSLCPHSANNSDAVIFHGRNIPKTLTYKRPPGQVWIFAEDESPLTYDYDGQHWRSENWRHAFNWTMTYDKSKTDIYLPSGELWPKKVTDRKNFYQIAKNKSKTAIIISSHCTTESLRMEYVKELQKYIDVDVLGTCGREWHCGKAWIHDDCFAILNKSYKFYLAFENALCRGYRTEKFFENFNYDIVMVARAGLGKRDIIEPRDAYISASDYSSPQQLGIYLKQLSENPMEYAELLQQKSNYYYPGFGEFYQRALCDICERMNNQDKYRRTITDLVKHVDVEHSCKKPKDVEPEPWSIFSWFNKKW